MAVHFISLPLVKLSIVAIAPAKRVMRGILTYLFVHLLCKLLEKVIAFLVANFSSLTFMQLPHMHMKFKAILTSASERNFVFCLKFRILRQKCVKFSLSIAPASF